MWKLLNSSPTLRAILWIAGPWTVGSILAVILPPSSSLPKGIDRLSALIGWTYFMAWSFSFYPQILYNQRRRSVIGLSIDFQVLNLLGFVALSAFYGGMLYSPSVREAYRKTHRGESPAVHTNDLGFAVNAMLATLLTLFQCCIYENGGARPSRATIVSVSAVIVLILSWSGAIVAFGSSQGFLRHILHPLTLLYFISYIKLGISLIKYIPQVVLNYRRKSTKGWNIWQVWLDFEGGMLSVIQLLMDAAVCSDWTAVTGNPVKFGLGFVSMMFDLIFMVQHYMLYPKSRRSVAEEAMDQDFDTLETEGLLAHNARSIDGQ